MSWLDSIFGGDSPLEVGNRVLGAYYSEASLFPEFTYPSYENWVTYLSSKVPGFAEFIGELVISNSANTSVSGSADRLIELANRTGGQASIPEITKVAGWAGDTVNWAELFPSVAMETVEDVAELAVETAENVGSGVIGTVNLVKFLPWILLGGAALYIGVVASKHGSLFKR